MSAPPPAYSSVPTQAQSGPTTVVVTNSVVVVTGNCPGCRTGSLRYSFTCCGVLLAIIFFPIGILFCFLLADKKCNHCKGTF